MSTYVEPEFKKSAFTCPNCNAYSSFRWMGAKVETYPGMDRQLRDTRLYLAYCNHCDQENVWFRAGPNNCHMILPLGITNAPLPHDEMPDDVKSDYLEARNIAALSPRGSAALLRLAIQRLCKHLGEKGDKIDADIKSLVQKGLPVRIQQALDIVRVTGNNAVHPGELKIEDDPDITARLFKLVNLIVDNRIAEPKRIEEAFQALPERALDGIKKRDKS